MTPNHTTTPLIAPHGGTLIDRLLTGEAAAPYIARAEAAQAADAAVTLSAVSQSDLLLIATGVVSPLTGFMGSQDYQRVVHEMHLSSGLPFTIPITLPVSQEQADALSVGSDVALLDADGGLLGLLVLSEKYGYDKAVEAEKVYRTPDEAHPGVARVYANGPVYLAGEVWMLREPQVESPEIYRSPAQTRAIFAERGWRRVAAFQTRNPVHRAHEYLMKVALEIADGLMLHPLVGETKADDIPAETRVACYKVVLSHYFPAERTLLTGFPAAMRYAGPREAVFHAIARKNYGITHFIVGRDHAGVGKYYGTYDAQQIFDAFDPAEIGITPLLFEHAFYSKSAGQIVTAKTSPTGPEDWVHLSGTQVRALLSEGKMLPEEFTRPEVSKILLESSFFNRSGAE